MYVAAGGKTQNYVGIFVLSEKDGRNAKSQSGRTKKLTAGNIHGNILS